MVCLEGTAYWTIDYTYEGVCVHTAETGKIYGKPNPVNMLDKLFSRNENHYQDVENPDPAPEDLGTVKRPGGSGTAGGRPAWWEKHTKSHRQAIIDAMRQIVKE